MSTRRRSKQTGQSRLLAVVLLGAGLAAGVVLFLLRPQPAALVRATVLDEPIALPDFRLTDHRAEAFTRSRFEGRASLVFFGFTNCPDICPVTLQKLAVVRRRLAEQSPPDTLPDIVFVSVDPARDDVESVAAYARAFGEGVIGVTGDLAEIDKLTGALGIYHARPEAGDGSYTVEHSAAVIVVNERAEFHAVFSAPHDVDVIVGDLALIIESS